MKTLKIAIVGILLSTALLAQDIRMGIVLEPKLSWLSSDLSTVDNDGMRMGFGFGFNFDYYFADNYGITTGLLINSTGGKLKFSEQEKIINIGNYIPFKLSENDLLSPDIAITYKLQYLEIPFALKFKTNEIGMITYTGQMGINIEVNVGAKGDITAENKGMNKEKMNKEINFMNLSYHAGAGIEYNLDNNTSLIAGIYYKQGFTDITTDIKKFEKEIDTDGDGVTETYIFEREKDISKLGNIVLRLGFAF